MLCKILLKGDAVVYSVIFLLQISINMRGITCIVLCSLLLSACAGLLIHSCWDDREEKGTICLSDDEEKVTSLITTFFSN